jgi:predicted ATPase
MITGFGGHSSRPSESPLPEALRLSCGLGSTRWGFFLRAETMPGFYSYLEANPQTGEGDPEPAFHEISHGESFLALLRSRFRTPADALPAARAVTGQERVAVISNRT